MNFAKKLRQARNKLLRLDVSFKIGNSHFVNKFLNSLCFQFNIFLITFNQIHSLIMLAKSNNQTGVKKVTFQEAVTSVNKKKNRVTIVEHQSSKTVAFMSNFTMLTDNKTTITVPYSTNCNKNYHTVNNY